MAADLEKMLAFQCAPTFAGLKPANLVSCCKIRYPDLSQTLGSYNLALNPADLFFEVLYEGGNRALVLVYRRKLLARYLETEPVKAFLSEGGYPESLGMEKMFSFLKLRMALCEGFPHEIGLFLGYPLEDVKGFMENKGKNFKMSGYWKVYANEKETSGLFRRYTKCRNEFCKRVFGGMSIMQLLHVAS